MRERCKEKWKGKKINRIVIKWWENLALIVCRWDSRPSCQPHQHQGCPSSQGAPAATKGCARLGWRACHSEGDLHINAKEGRNCEGSGHFVLNASWLLSVTEEEDRKLLRKQDCFLHLMITEMAKIVLKKNNNNNPKSRRFSYMELG